MITQTMVNPSSWVATGITIEKVRDRYLFKFSEELQSRLDNLNQRLKENQLVDAERAELAGILELDQIFMVVNGKIIAES